VLTTSHRAFGAAPLDLPRELEPVPGAEKVELRMLRGARYAGSAVAGAAGTAARGVGWAGRKVGELTSRRTRTRTNGEIESDSTARGGHELPGNSGSDGAPH
jgi:hypothetical protein